ncbi:MAG: GAF domain-containing protein [Cyanobacteria bacterium P01_A01_bin.3]
MVQPTALDSTYESPFVTLDSVLRQIRDSKRSQEVVQLCLDFISTTFDAPLVWIAFYDSQQHQLVGQGGTSLVPNCSLLDKAIAIEPGQILEQVAIEQRKIAVPDVPQETRMGPWQEEAKRLGIVGCLLIPIRYGDRCLGVLMMGSQLWGGTASDEEVAILGILNGQMASTLQLIRERRLQQEQKQADIPLVALGTAMRNFDSFDERVKAAISQIQAFVEAKQVRVFWLDRQFNEFAPRWSSRPAPLKTGAQNPDSDLAVAGPTFTARELEPTFSTLVEGRLVTVGEAGLSGRIPINARTLKSLDCRSVMLVPVLFEGELLGFVSVESDYLRSWTEAEQTLAVGVVQFIALAAPLEVLEQTLQRIQQDRQLTSQVAQTIYAQTDWNTALSQIAEQLCARLDATACLMLQTASDVSGYRVRIAHSRDRTLSFPDYFPPLTGRDLEDLLCEDTAIAAESYPEDLRLTAWQEELKPAGVRSILAARTTALTVSPDRDLTNVDPEGIVLIVNPQPRGWHREDRQLLLLVARQVGVVFRQWKLRDNSAANARMQQRFGAAVEGLNDARTLPELFEAIVTHLKHVFSVPLVAALSWLDRSADSNSTTAMLNALQTTEDFHLSSNNPSIAVEGDALIQWSLQSSSPLLLQAADLHDSSRQWLDAAPLGQLMAIAVDCRPSPYLPSLLLVVGDVEARQWQQREQDILESLRGTVASNLNRIVTQQVLLQRVGELLELNWYKHRQLSTTSLCLRYQLKRMLQGLPETKDNRWKKQEESIRSTIDIPKDLKTVGAEYWAVTQERTELLSATLIRRVLRRADPLVQKYKLWPRVRGEATATVLVHAARLEMVLVELIGLIGKRCEEGGALELWCQVEGERFSLSLVDSAQPLPSDLLELLDHLHHHNRGFEWLSPLYDVSLLQTSPGRELSICQAAMSNMGGELEVYQADDGRTVTQLHLPVTPQ